MSQPVGDALAAETAAILDIVVTKIIALEDGLTARDARIAALEEQRQADKASIAALEAKFVVLDERRYSGVWRSGETYRPGNEVTHQGGRWYCHAETSKRPGESKDWQLTQKSVRHRNDDR